MARQPELTHSQMRGKYSRSIARRKRFRETARPAASPTYSPPLALFNFPVSGRLVTQLKQPVLGIMSLAALGALQIAGPPRALAIMIFRHREGRAATARDDVHSQSAGLRFHLPAQLQPSSAIAIDFLLR